MNPLGTVNDTKSSAHTKAPIPIAHLRPFFGA
jgi:hypothetical protein